MRHILENEFALQGWKVAAWAKGELHRANLPAPGAPTHCVQNARLMNSKSKSMEKGKVSFAASAGCAHIFRGGGFACSLRATHPMLPAALQNIARNRPQDLLAQNR